MAQAILGPAETAVRSTARLARYLKDFKRARVLVVGDFILDQFVWGDVERISPEAPVPVVMVQRESYMPGGALNVANNIRSLGGTVYPCGVAGRDVPGRLLVRTMRRMGIDTGGVLYDTARPTTLKTRVIAHSQQVVRFDREKVGDISKAQARAILEFVRRRIRDVAAVILEDYGKGTLTPAVIQSVVKLARRHGVFVLVDPKEKHFPFYRGVTALTPNLKEAVSGSGLAVDHKGVDVGRVGMALLRKMGAQAVLVTLGERGMALFERGRGPLRIPTVAREVYDVSGAGDTVIAVFALSIACGAPFRDAAVLANLAAGIVVGKLGTAAVEPEELARAIERGWA